MSTYIWFDTQDDLLLVSQTKSGQKYKTVRWEPRFAILIVDSTNPYRYLEIRVAVIRVDEDPDKAFISRMAKKYIDQDVYPWSQPGDERVVVVVKPEHTSKMG